MIDYYQIVILKVTSVLEGYKKDMDIVKTIDHKDPKDPADDHNPLHQAISNNQT
jgi:hypothetical protein